jgi:hypothetical protein
MRQPGGIVKAAGLGDGPTQGKITIAKLRLTMPPTTLGDFAFALGVIIRHTGSRSRTHVSKRSMMQP